MENQDQSYEYLKRLSGGLLLVLMISASISIGMIMFIQALGSSETLKWFMGPFVGFFFGTLGLFHVVNRPGLKDRT